MIPYDPGRLQYGFVYISKSPEPFFDSAGSAVASGDIHIGDAALVHMSDQRFTVHILHAAVIVTDDKISLPALSR